MPIPLAAAIAGGASLLGAGANYAATTNLNKKNRQFTREMWDKQNNVNNANYARDIAYNAPSNQRKLFEEAGMNPALLYESGGGFQSASSPAAPSAGSPSTKAPEFDLGSVAGSYYDASLKTAQLDNIKGATANAAASTAAEIALKTSQTSANTFDTGMKNRLATYTAEAAEKANKLLDADISLRLNQGYKSVDEREKIVQEIKSIKQQMTQSDKIFPLNVQQLKNNAKFQSFKAELNSMGLTEHDSVLWRLFGTWGKKAADAADKDLNKTPKFKNLHPNNQY